MTPMEQYRSLPRDGSTFFIDTIHGLCRCHHEKQHRYIDRFVFTTKSGTVWWHRDVPSITTELLLGAVPMKEITP